MSATPLPVSIALAGHTKAGSGRNVSATSRIAQVRIAARICGTLTWKRSPTCPRTWIVMMTAATCSRGSRMFGRITGYVLPPSVSVRLVTSSPPQRPRRRPHSRTAVRPGPTAAPRSRRRARSLWFNPVVPDVPAAAVGTRRAARRSSARDGGSSVRSRWSSPARSRSCCPSRAAVGRRAPISPRFVDETTVAGIDHTYDGEFEFFVGGGVAAFDCDDDGRADLFFAGGSEPAALYRNESPVGGALRFARQASPVTDLTAVTGAYPLDIDSDRHQRPRRPPPRRQRRPPRARRLPLRGRQRAARRRRRRRAGRSRSARRGRARTPGPRWRSATTSCPTGSVCDDSQLVRPAPTGERYAPPIALTPGYCTLSMLFSDWSRSGQRDLRAVERPALLHATARSSSGGSRPARRPGSTPRPTVGARCRSGGWASPART